MNFSDNDVRPEVSALNHVSCENVRNRFLLFTDLIDGSYRFLSCFTFHFSATVMKLRSWNLFPYLWKCSAVRLKVVGTLDAGHHGAVT
jgi:hypothetical protein